MAKEELEIGDIVQLKSGGPRMTVSGFPNTEYVSTDWFAGGKIQKDSFPRAALNKVVEEKK